LPILAKTANEKQGHLLPVSSPERSTSQHGISLRQQRWNTYLSLFIALGLISAGYLTLVFGYWPSSCVPTVFCIHGKDKPPCAPLSNHVKTYTIEVPMQEVQPSASADLLEEEEDVAGGAINQQPLNVCILNADTYGIKGMVRFFKR
jgi:hypothetical protein